MNNLKWKRQKKESFFFIIFKIWDQLKKKRKNQLIKLFIIMLLSGISEIFSLVSIMPFLSVITDPKILWELNYIRNISLRFGFIEPNQLIFPITIFFIISVVLTSLIRIINLKANLYLSAAIGSDLSCEAYLKTLYQPYEVHLKRNSSEMVTTTTSFINLAVAVFTLILQLFTSLVISISLIATLLFIDFKISLLLIFIFTSAYLMLGTLTKRILVQNSNLITKAGEDQVRSLMEGLGSIRDVILNNSQKEFLEIYKKADRLMRYRQASSKYLAYLPRFALEGLALVVIASISLILVLNSSLETLPILGAFALGGQRLLPALQQSYSAWAGIKANKGPVLEVIKMTSQYVKPEIKLSKKHDINFRQSITLENVSFQYSKSSNKVLKNINLHIKKGEKIGIIGTTGSGKSTFMDILMGLIPPSEGKMFVDSNEIYKNQGFLLNWRKIVSHVPQNIFLNDTSIAENVAFGIPKGKIDIKRLKKVLEISQLKDFISKSREGIDLIVGERGTKLSGGQCQRIGIARALYNQKDIIFLDEATSALDYKTEGMIINSLTNSNKELTLIMVTHRPSSLSNFDRIFELKDGYLFETKEIKSL